MYRPSCIRSQIRSLAVRGSQWGGADLGDSVNRQHLPIRALPIWLHAPLAAIVNDDLDHNLHQDVVLLQVALL